MAMNRSSRPAHSRPRTARERVAQRRGSKHTAPSTPTITSRNRQGCQRPLVWGGVGIALLALLLVGSLLRWTYGALQGLEQDDPRAPTSAANSPAGGLAVGTAGKPFTVLLLGVDRRDDPNEGARSDTLIVVRVDPAGQWAAMLSIPRDSITTIARAGIQAKINYAYTYGYENAATLYGPSTTPLAAGGALTAETVEGFLGTPIDYIAQVDFHGFAQIVDSLGGIMIDVPQPLLDAEYPTADYGVERIFIPAGLQRLDGNTALQYARSRHADSDFGRSKRQQQVLQALLREARQKGLLEQAAALPALARSLEQSVVTTLPISDPAMIQQLAALAQKLDASRVMQLALNADEVELLAEQGSDLYWDDAGVKALTARLLAGPTGVEAPVSAPVRVQVQNGAGVAGIAASMSNYLAREGFVVAAAGDAAQPAPYTTIVDRRDDAATRTRLAALLRIAPGHVQVTTDAAVPGEADIVVVVGADYNADWLR